MSLSKDVDFLMWKIMINHGIVGYPSPIFGQTHIAPLPRTQKRCGKRHEGHRHGTENTPTNHLKIKSCSQAWPFPCTIPLSSTFFHQGSMVQPDFPPEKPQGRTWLGLLLLLAAAGSAEVRSFENNSPSDVFFFGGGKLQQFICFL